MTRSTDPELNAALQADAAKLEAMDQNPGPELEDFDFGDDDGLDEDGNIPFECSAYWISGSRQKKGYWHCPLAGSEECDWECPGHPGEPA